MIKTITRFCLLNAILLVSLLSTQSFAGSAITSLFSFGPTPVCIGNNVTFSDLSTASATITTWKWSFGNGASIANFNGQTPPAIQYSISGKIIVSLKVIDNLGDSASSSQVFYVERAFADAGSNVSICSNSSISIGTPAISGYSYNWSPTTGLSSTTVATPTANPSATTTYTLTTIASNGCAASSQVTVTNIGKVTADAGVDKIICSGGSTTIGAAPVAGYSYFWTSSVGNSLSSTGISNPVASPTTTTTYIITAAAANCVAFDTVIVHTTPSPILSANDTISKCEGATVNIGTSAVSGYTYSWSPTSGITSSTIANPIATTTASQLYTLVVSNSLHCSSSKTVYVNVYNPLKAFAGLSQLVCFGNSIFIGGSPVVATGGSGAYIYSWTPSATLNNALLEHPNATPLTNTTYYLSVSDQAGSACGSAHDSVVLTIAPLPHPIINMPTEFCHSATSTAITLSATPTGGIFSGNGVQNNIFYPNANSIVLGTPYPITYAYTDNGCSYDTSISVVVFATPVADAGLNETMCKNLGQSSVMLNATGGSTYSWTPSASLSNATISNPTASPSVTTTYFVTVSQNSCSATDSVVITVSNFCNVDSILIANPDRVQVPMNTTSSINYITNDQLLNHNNTYSSFIFLPALHGTATIASNKVLHYTPNNNYIGFDTLIYQLCDSTIGSYSPHQTCDTAIVFIAVAPIANNDNYLVHCNDSIASNVLLNDQYGNGAYPITISNVILPKFGSVRWVNNTTVHYVPNTSFVGNDTFAYSLCVNGLCSVAYVYFRVNCENLPIAVNDYLNAGNNETTPTNELNNDIYDSLTPLIVSIIGGPSHGSASVNGNNNINYTPTAGYVGLDSIEYVICNGVGCDTAWIILKVYDNSPCQIPNGFSPNGDGVNDVFVINCANRYPKNRLTIFNRWGNEIFSRLNYNNDWDGTYKNSVVPDGTYYYIFEINDGNQKAKTGYIEVRR